MAEFVLILFVGAALVLIRQWDRKRVARRNAVSASRPGTSPPSRAGAALSPVDELTKLTKLRDDGVLTAQEFEAQKRKLLA